MLKLKHTRWDLFAEVYWSSGLWCSQSAWLNSFFYPYLCYFPSFFSFEPSAVNFQSVMWDKELVVFAFYEPNHIFCAWIILMMTTHRLLNCLLAAFIQKEWREKSTLCGPLRPPFWWNAKLQLSKLSSFFASHQGRHVKTGQLAAIKVMDVTEVSKHHRLFTL